MNKKGYVYIMTNHTYGTLYIGVTSNLEQRVLQHKNKIYGGFTAKYNLTKLVRYNEFPTIKEAIEWEKKLKAGNRARKIMLIEQINPSWEDLMP
ncbi:MAG: GIY-YIG nuclease family protein [Candidatus Peribacteria bacterium]|jgi:putative endonuclease|nr:GIY-YIG nuclease family protein [Candidatus Peribacteria bacterium]